MKKRRSQIGIALIGFWLAFFGETRTFGSNKKSFPEVFVKKGSAIVLKLDLPEGFKLNPQAPNLVVLREANTRKTAVTWNYRNLKPLQIPIQSSFSESGAWLLEGAIFVCEKTNLKVCMAEKFEQPFRGSLRSHVTEIHWAVGVPVLAR